MNILDYIPIGHENAISRETLATVTQLSDRKLRDLISEINQNNDDSQIIINLQDGKGYFRPAEDEDNLVLAWDKIGDSRYKNYRRNASSGERYLRWKNHKQKQRENKLDGQMNIFDFLKGG